MFTDPFFEPTAPSHCRGSGREGVVSYECTNPLTDRWNYIVTCPVCGVYQILYVEDENNVPDTADVPEHDTWRW